MTHAGHLLTTCWISAALWSKKLGDSERAEALLSLSRSNAFHSSQALHASAPPARELPHAACTPGAYIFSPLAAQSVMYAVFAVDNGATKSVTENAACGAEC